MILILFTWKTRLSVARKVGKNGRYVLGGERREEGGGRRQEGGGRREEGGRRKRRRKGRRRREEGGKEGFRGVIFNFLGSTRSHPKQKCVYVALRTNSGGQTRKVRKTDKIGGSKFFPARSHTKFGK
jgi:hypothetical protein